MVTHSCPGQWGLWYGPQLHQLPKGSSLPLLREDQLCPYSTLHEQLQFEAPSLWKLISKRWAKTPFLYLSRTVKAWSSSWSLQRCHGWSFSQFKWAQSIEKAASHIQAFVQWLMNNHMGWIPRGLVGDELWLRNSWSIQRTSPKFCQITMTAFLLCSTLLEHKSVFKLYLFQSTTARIITTVTLIASIWGETVNVRYWRSTQIYAKIKPCLIAPYTVLRWRLLWKGAVGPSVGWTRVAISLPVPLRAAVIWTYSTSYDCKS